MPIPSDDYIKQKAKQIRPVLDSSWEPYLYELLEGGELMVTGCHTRPFKRGPRKGKTKYLTDEGRLVVVLSRGECEPNP